MKRILIFSLAYLPHVGGAEIAIKEITSRISRKDIAFDLITLRFDRKSSDVEMVGNVRVYRVKWLENLGYTGKILFPVLAAIGVYRLHKKNHYDGFWAMMSYMLFPIVLLRFIGINVPYVLTLQEGDPFEHMYKRLRILPFLFLLKSGFRHATIVQVISNYLATWARAMGFKGHIEVIPNGSDTLWFGKKDHETQNRIVFWKNRHDMDGSKFILITTSRLVRKNGIDDAIRSLTMLPKNIHFVILGMGREEAVLKKLRDGIWLHDRVHFFGEVSNTDIANYLAMSDIFIRPSRSEGMGNSFIEAMAAGIPVIATQEGGIADFLFDAKRNADKVTTGWAVDKDNPEQIAEAVKDIIAHPEKVAKVTETAKKMVIEKYDWDLIAKDMKEKVFDQVFKK